MRQLFIFIVSLFPLSVYAETTFILKEIKDVYIEEITSANRSTLFRFEVDYSNPDGTSGPLRSACWPSLEEMKTVFYSHGLGVYAETFNDGKIRLNGSGTVLNYFGGDNSINGLTYVTSLSGFNDETWVLYCSIVTNDYSGGQILFRPTTLTYTIVNLHASSMAYPHISAPAVIDLKTCSPGDNLKAAIPLTVGFVGYMGQSKNMELTVKSNDLPDDFDIVLDNQSILNKPPQVIQMPAGQKEKQIETHLKGKCPNQAGEYIWNAEYITTIQ
ncbi:hypothetical protein [Providencia alcalifaciens]|uniref:hypothetical protein n=1 Tax=Providencia alcalifaciens TaxID=126385 RepID=UPI000D3B20D2|nr:hypothetical protein [Providencia alcalifaciens]MBG5884429.1 hypothetical protein [Providencia alcalifaciens]MDR2241739.1 hypothetical protein [Providencia alcalifaciens]